MIKPVIERKLLVIFCEFLDPQTIPKDEVQVVWSEVIEQVVAVTT